MDETEYLLSSSANAKRLQESVKELEEGLKGKEWPQEFKDLAGVWKDLPTAEEIRQEQGRQGSHGGYFFSIWADKEQNIAANVRDMREDWLS